MADLQTARLVLRPIVRADAPAIQKHFPHWDIVKYLTNADPADVPTRGFWLAQEHQGKGYMTEAVFAVNTYIFDVLGVEKLIIKNARDNKGSHRVKAKTGAVLIGVEPSPGKYLGDYEEQEIWELTADNFRRARDGDAA